MTATGTYIHGSTQTEQQRLALMNDLINDRCLQALSLNAERLVLDVGAGTGQFTRRIAEGFVTAAGYDRAIENLRAFVNVPGAAVWYGINWAEGRKP